MKNAMSKCLLTLPCLLIYTMPAIGETENANSDQEKVKLDSLYITGGAEQIKKQPGSAHLLDQQDIEKFDYTDINRVLTQVPGVNIQEEEGYGLRPNIGLRGAHPHRSRKITLMEDGILIGPAPYSAPAAYYFPMFAKMEGVEVFKGPSAIKYGPNTVGGAVNLATRSVPVSNQGRVNIAYGEDQFSKLHAYYGQRGDQWGWLLDGLHLQTDGFKKLDNGGDTGFEKSDITFKGLLTSDINADIYQELSLKLQYSDEDSNSTYTGLTQEDFDATPYRRYAGTAKDHMDAEHVQYMLSHSIELSPVLSFTTTVYRNEFSRLWSKLNGFNTTTSLSEIMANPENGTNADFLQVLKGETNSVDLGNEGSLIIGNNDRDYLSQGVQLLTHWQPMFWGLPNEFEFGLRYHTDQIERFHSEDGYLMENGQLISDGYGRVDTTVNKDSTKAIAIHLQDKLTYGDWIFTGGGRTEIIKNRRVDRSAGGNNDVSKRDDTIFIPGFGAFYQYSSHLGLLAGIYKGFTPVGPGQADSIEPEKSINYEAGYRYSQGAFSNELIGFYNDYSNIKGVCTFSSGCDEANIDQEFNGGKAEIIGLELTLGYSFQLDTINVPLKFDYTFTQAEFANTFTSNNPDWGAGEINDGDPLPYIPEHQFSFSSGLVSANWALNSTIKFVGERNDTANEEVIPQNRVIDAYAVMDLKGSYTINKDVTVYASAKNLLDKVYVTSLRPYGARPGIPQQLQVGLKAKF